MFWEGRENEQCQKHVKPLFNTSSNEQVTKSFNSRVAKCDDLYPYPFEFKISLVIFELQFGHVV
jgi:hypothetical protein